MTYAAYFSDVWFFSLTQDLNPDDPPFNVVVHHNAGLHFPGLLYLSITSFQMGCISLGIKHEFNQDVDFNWSCSPFHKFKLFFLAGAYPVDRKIKNADARVGVEPACS